MIPLEEIRRARERLGADVLRTPLVPIGDAERIWLKLECLQPVGSFKLRGALSAIRAASAAELERGVVTASAGNMAQGVAWAARELGLPARVIVPADAPRAKLDRVEALGAEIVPVTHEEWWQAVVDRGREGVEGLFVHPVADEAVMAGNGTIGLELDALRPDVRVVTVEPETAAPLAASFAAGEPTDIEFTPSWVDGAGGRGLLPGMWDRARGLVDDAVAVSLAEAEDAVRLLASRAHVVAEGAGALALAAALKRDDRCVCIVSGGNIDPDVYAAIINPAAAA
jgi:threonine dehydratase